MAATKNEKSTALAVLTSAALGLPGLHAEAAVPVSEPEANVQYGFYQESDDRMQVDVYHADFIVPFSDRLEFSFSVDRDTYSGATPVYSLPDVTSADVVSSASGVTDPFGMTAGILLACNPGNPGCKTDATAEEKETNAYYFNLRRDAETEFTLNKINEFGGGTTGVVAYIAWISDPDNQVEQRVAVDSDVMDTLLNQPITATTQSSQVLIHQPEETRIMPIFSTNIYFDSITLGLSGGISDESDFFSRFGSANVSWELNNKLTTLSAGYSYTGNDIFRSAPSVDENGGHNHGAVTSDFAEASVFNSVNFGFSQILTKNSLVQFSSSYTHQKGYLTNPYKFVNIRNEISGAEYSEAANNGLISDWSYATDLEVVGVDLFYEVRPEQRDQWSFSTRLNQYLPDLNAAVHLDYRYYFDNWNIDSHALELTWYQSLPMGFSVTPSIRYYSQSQANFFAPYFLDPREDGHYSSDYRLSSFGAISGGLTIGKEFVKGITLDAGFEYYVRESDLALDEDIDTSYADYDFYMIHANLNVNLGAVGRGMGEGGHHHHMHHSAPLPTGVKFGHMMPKAGDFMIGYQYAYANQSGAMKHGSSTVSDASLVYTACGVDTCAARPSEMRMDMHMLNLMYAPTDWLNLMLMPQIMDMDMSLVEIPGAVEDNLHGDGHTSGGLGDTIAAALFKLYDGSGHHLHLGLGISAPTGDTDVTFEGIDSPDSTPQDYGMQLGSGTWDFIPSLTYTGELDKWSWGAQVSGIKRMQDRNSSGYALGDVFDSTVWGGYKLANWLSASVRGKYSAQGSIKGEYSRTHLVSTPVDLPENYGGQLWDIGIGLNASVSGGSLMGHQFAVEWLQPVAEDFNGYQLEREGTLLVNWSYMF